MKMVALLFLSIALCFSASASAGTNIKAPDNAPVGEWVNEVEPSGSTVRVRMTVTTDHRFSGVKLVDGVLTWTFSGIWAISGDEFTYIHKESPIPLPENFKDTDIIISVEFQANFKGSDSLIPLDSS